MKIGFLFPGQGSQYVGMGKDLYEKYEEARNVYDRVQEITGYDIKKISFEGPEEVLNETKYTQVAILTMSLAMLEVLKKQGIKADMSAGLSLGEYSALIYANTLSFEDGIKIVQKRGQFMQELSPKGDWLMLAILGLNEEQVIEACKKVKRGFVTPANFNCPGQIVVSGEREAVIEAGNYAKELGAKKVAELKTAGPFHTSKLIESSNALREELNNITINKFDSVVVKNLDGSPYSESDDIKDILADHIVNPVRFSDAINTMIEKGIDTFVEIGPGRSLSGFVKRTSREVKTLNICDINSLDETINYIK